MTMIRNTYGKNRVRVMRVHRDGPHHSVRELSVQAMLEGDFAATYTEADNRLSVATDTIKNLTYVVAREALDAEAEAFGQKLATRFLDLYPQVERATVTTHETRWRRASFAGQPHDHNFVLDANGKPFAEVAVTRDSTAIRSGIEGYTFMKSTQSGWFDFHRDAYTTLPDTSDRLCATAMDAYWTWSAIPESYDDTNARILATMLEVFGTTYSHSVQDSLYRMGVAALAEVPQLATVSLACPNKHYLPVNLAPFGLASDNAVFIPTDEPHGQIECVVGRSQP
jgi:urate oxidase